MTTAEHLIVGLKKSGHRLTRARRALIGLLADAASPLSVPDMLMLMGKAGVLVNRTTVYREVEFLKDIGMLSEVRAGEGPMLYELTPEGEHHHHLICTGCKRVECVEVERCLGPEFKAIEHKSSFKVTDHSLQLYGLCRRCR